MYQDTKGITWNVEKCTFIFQKIERWSGIYRIEVNPFWPMSSQQNNKEASDDDHLTCWWSKYLSKDGWKVTKIMKWLGKIYGGIKVKRGQKHHYLGIDLNFECKGEVKVSMIPYVGEIIKKKSWRFWNININYFCGRIFISDERLKGCKANSRGTSYTVPSYSCKIVIC